ncbi:phage portal protein [Anaerobacillus sp. HL2]|nr:phage portal protein [Anaerobacillus sp. HL2]
MTRIKNGIEYNEFNRPIAYYFKEYDVHGFYSGKSERIANDVFFFMAKEKRPSQIREMSEMVIHNHQDKRCEFIHGSRKCKGKE